MKQDYLQQLQDMFIILGFILFVLFIILLFTIKNSKTMSAQGDAIKALLGKISDDVDRIKAKLESATENGLSAEETKEILDMANAIDLKVPEDEA